MQWSWSEMRIACKCSIYQYIYRCVYKEHLHICRSSTVHSWEPLLITFSLRKFSYAQPSQLRLVHKHPSTLHGCPVLPLPKPAAPKLRRAGSRSKCIHEPWSMKVYGALMAVPKSPMRINGLTWLNHLSMETHRPRKAYRTMALPVLIPSLLLSHSHVSYRWLWLYSYFSPHPRSRLADQ